MEYDLKISNIVFHFDAPFKLKIEESIRVFLQKRSEKRDVFVEINTDFEKAPKLPGDMRGEDLLLKYYLWERGILCVAKGGGEKNISITTCNPSFRKLVCYLNLELFSESTRTVGNILRLLPIRMILTSHNTLFFHASQIAIDNTGILFSAASGTGKTTQARLWEQYRKADIICNDRTLVCKGKTYGYPIDGSEPVISGEIHSLGAIVLLAKSRNNHIQRLKIGKALPKLMEQLVFDTWDSHQKEMIMELLMELLEKIPVYLLSCTPDEEAVFCLEQQLKKDGVLK